ncbi:MAG: hypothetical protein EBZ77_08150 [Chitinophagia bacterium]|nr:hypothetical protein [Chitinophagia bacterium]
MDSIFAQLFGALKQHIAAHVAGIRYIDQDLGQLKLDKPPVSWPCVLIDLEQMNYTPLGNNVQTGEGIVVLRLGLMAHSAASQLAPVLPTARAVKFYELEWALNQAIHGWNPLPQTGRLCRISAATQKRNDNCRVRELRYSIAIEDFSTKWKQTMAPAGIVVDSHLAK